MKAVFALVILSVFLVHFCESAPYQMLPPKDGYVPVYIRVGDTPLEDINPDLAFAFHEFGISGRNIKSNLEDEMMADQPNASSASSEEKEKEKVVPAEQTSEVAAASNDSASSKSSEETKEQINAEPSKAPESPTDNKAEQ